MIDLVKRMFCNHKWKLLTEGHYEGEFSSGYYYLYVCEKCLKRKKITN